MKRLVMLAVLILAWSSLGQASEIILSRKVKTTRGAADSTNFRVIGPGAAIGAGDPDTSETFNTDGWDMMALTYYQDDNDTTACCDSIDYRIAIYGSSDQTNWIQIDSTMIISDSTVRMDVFDMSAFPFPYMRLIERGRRGHGRTRAWSEGTIFITAKGIKGGWF